MSDKVQVALAEDIAEAEEIQAILESAGIAGCPADRPPPQIPGGTQHARDHHRLRSRRTDRGS